MEHWILFLGRFHPLFVHLPIGILFAVVVMECLRGLRKEKPSSAEITLLVLVLCSALAAVVTGLMLEREGGYAKERVQAHMLLGISMTVMIFLALVLKVMSVRRQSTGLPYYIVLGLSTLLMVAASHQGGVLTHGRYFLTEHFPFASKPADDSSPTVAESTGTESNLISYELHIQPLMEAHCVECHNADKMKADLRLDSHEAIMAGSKWGEVVVPGKPDDSSFFFLLTFPEDDPDRMPKDGDPLTPEQIKIVSDWISQGANKSG